ncbi:hypothetical protein HHK36_018332 [Tetracentron sinense]|uniref:Uncharacterized protein n=1 Tax=Tetracentron sinense TaxID=13715 RepID=A0A834Z001_TETSI|nr:hypothetical protein HHK36_018332 [Tetracentron sinense]
MRNWWFLNSTGEANLFVLDLCISDERKTRTMQDQGVLDFDARVDVPFHQFSLIWDRELGKYSYGAAEGVFFCHVLSSSSVIVSVLNWWFLNSIGEASCLFWISAYLMSERLRVQSVSLLLMYMDSLFIVLETMQDQTEEASLFVLDLCIFDERKTRDDARPQVVLDFETGEASLYVLDLCMSGERKTQGSICSLLLMYMGILYFTVLENSMPEPYLGTRRPNDFLGRLDVTRFS